MAVSDVLASLRQDADGELLPLFLQLEDQWERKLWHQLTHTLVELFADPRSAPLRIPLYERFVATFERQINALAAVSLAVTASEQCATPQESLEFMRGVTTKLETAMAKDNVARDVLAFAQLRIAALHVALEQPGPAKKLLDAARIAVDELPISDSAVLAQFHGVCCEFYKMQADYTAYYRSALLYLACVRNLDALSPTARQQKAHDLCVAALLAPKIYNFGELVLHPILQSLDNEYAWLRELLLAVNAGDVPKFQSMRADFCAKMPLLENSLPFLEQKICLMALCECVFRRQHSERTIPFAAVAKETYLQTGAKVEVLVMKAFSLGLMRGTVDEITQTVQIDWLQPRVLSLQQMATMRERLAQWDAGVKDLGEFMRVQGSEVWHAV